MNEDTMKVAWLIEKATKGIKKQLKGYVKSIKDELDGDYRHLEHQYNDFKSDYRRAQILLKNATQLESLIDEYANHKKLAVEMQKMMREIRNQEIDRRLAITEFKHWQALIERKLNNMAMSIDSLQKGKEKL